MPAAKKTKRPPYAARTEKRPVQVWLTNEEREKIEAAAGEDMRPMTQILLLGGLQLAEKILGKMRKR